MPLGLALILVGVLGGIVVYNTAQAAIQKARLVNAADAAAYSGVQWQARALNFQAYTNRAMVANQVSMAQAVTLESWTTYGRTMSENIARVLSAVPFVGAIAAGAETVVSTVDEVVSPIAGAMLSVIDGINAAIGFSQEAMFAATFASVPAIVDAVVEASDPRFSADTAYGVAGVLGNLAAWHGFTDQVDNGPRDASHMRERASIIRESQDAFTLNRDWNFFGDYLYIAPGVKIDIIKEGRTELIEREVNGRLEWEWKAKDTLSFHTRINLLFKNKHIEVPIGYGGAFANNARDGARTIQAGACSSYTSRSDDCVRMLDENALAERLVDTNTRSLAGAHSLVDMSGYSGLRSFRRLADDTRQQPMPTLKLRVEAAMPLASGSSSAGMTKGEPFQAPIVARGDLTSSISIAEVYFKPPDADLWKAGDRLEFANAYSPFWSVRLSAVPDHERLAAFAMRTSGSSVPSSAASVPGASAGLPDYDGAAVFDRAVGTAGRAVVDLGTAVVAEYGDRMKDDIADAIERELQDRLEGAVQEILAGIARGAADTVLGQRSSSMSEGVERQAASAEQARQGVQALQQEFRLVDDVLERQFGPYFEQQVAAWRREWGGRIRQLATAMNRPFRLFDVPAASAVEDGLLRDTAVAARLARRELLQRLSGEYARLVAETTNAFDMTPRMARQIVSMLLTAYEEAPDSELDYTLFDDVDLALPEPERESAPVSGDEGAQGA